MPHTAYSFLITLIPWYLFLKGVLFLKIGPRLLARFAKSTTGALAIMLELKNSGEACAKEKVESAAYGFG